MKGPIKELAKKCGSENMRVIVIGDVHGCLQELKELLDKVKYVPSQDSLIFVGDLVDRGPFSIETLRYVRALSENHGVVSLMGNHEIKYVKYARQLREGIAKQDKEVLISQAKQEIFQKLSEANIQWLACRPYHFQMDNLIIVHGGICPRRHKKLDDLGKKKYTERLYRLRWIGENGIMVPGLNYYDPSKHRPWADTYDGRFGVAVYGHNTFQTVRVSPYAFGIDTGCCFGGQLTALVQESSKPISFESVQARAVYYPRIELEE